MTRQEYIEGVSYIVSTSRDDVERQERLFEWLNSAVLALLTDKE